MPCYIPIKTGGLFTCLLLPWHQYERRIKLQKHVNMQKYGIASRRQNGTSSNFFVNDPDIVAQDKEDTEYVTKELIEEYQGLDLNVSILKQNIYI